MIAEITGFIRTAHVLTEFIGCSPAVGVSGNTGCVLRSAVPSYKHHIVAGVLVNIPGSDKGIDNAPVNLSFLCQIFYHFCVGGIVQREPEVRRWGGASVRLACACFAGQQLHRLREGLAVKLHHKVHRVAAPALAVPEPFISPHRQAVMAFPAVFLSAAYKGFPL